MTENIEFVVVATATIITLLTAILITQIGKR